MSRRAGGVTTGAPDIPADTGPRPVPEGAPMTDDELRIIAFLEASAAARPADFPDWMLALLEGDRPEEMGPELITAASLLYARRLHPGIGLDAARALMAESADDPALRSPTGSRRSGWPAASSGSGARGGSRTSPSTTRSTPMGRCR